MIEIISKENKIIKYYLKLLNKKDRDSEGLYLDFGLHSLTEITNKNLIVDVLSQNSTIATIKTTSTILKLFQNNKSVIDPVIVVRKKQPDLNTQNIIFLDGVQIPDNVGAIARSAVAFGIDTLALNERCADIYSEKSIRACQGAINKLNIISVHDSKAFLQNLVNEKFQVFSTIIQTSKKVNLRDATFGKKCCFVFGSEGKGIDIDILPNEFSNIYIPIQNIDSLNVGIASSIVLYEWSCKK